MYVKEKEEYDLLRSQIVTLKRGQHRKYLPYVFTEQRVAMLSSVLRSKLAIQVNIQIMRTFTKLREMIFNLFVLKPTGSRLNYFVRKIFLTGFTR